MTSPGGAAIPSNPAAALFAALYPVYIENPAQSIQTGLGRSFGADFATTDFWRIHRTYVRTAESVAVLVAAHQNLHAQYANYVESWRRGLIPSTGWDRPANENVNSYDVQSLNFLAGTLDVMNVSNAPLTEELSEKLANLSTSWRQLIEDLELPPALAAELLLRLNELDWLTANVARFGVTAVADAAERLASRATREIFKPLFPARARAGLIGLVGATMIFVGGANTASNDFAGAIEGINNSITQVHELEENVKGIFAGTLTRGEADDALSGGEGEKSDVVDAEVVDDTPPAE